MPAEGRVQCGREIGLVRHGIRLIQQPRTLQVQQVIARLTGDIGVWQAHRVHDTKFGQRRVGMGARTAVPNSDAANSEKRRHVSGVCRLSG